MDNTHHTLLLEESYGVALVSRIDQIISRYLAVQHQIKIFVGRAAAEGLQPRRYCAPPDVSEFGVARQYEFVPRNLSFWIWGVMGV